MNSLVSSTVPVTEPPACPISRTTPSTSAPWASGARKITTDLSASAPRTILSDIAASKSSAADSLSPSALFS